MDSGLRALCGIAAVYRIAADPVYLRRELALLDRPMADEDLVRAAKLIGLKTRIVRHVSPTRLSTMPTPTILRLKTGEFAVFGGKMPSGKFRIVDPVTRIDQELLLADLFVLIEPRVMPWFAVMSARRGLRIRYVSWRR